MCINSHYNYVSIDILFREYLRARGTDYLDEVIGEGWGAPTMNAIETTYDLCTNPIGTLLGVITNLVQQATAEEDADEDDVALSDDPLVVELGEDSELLLEGSEEVGLSSGDHQL